MGIEITEMTLHCDFKGCSEISWTDEISKETLEIMEWGVAASSPDISKWKVYCPSHRWLLKLLRNVLKEGEATG